MLNDSALATKSFALLLIRNLIAQYTQDMVVKVEVESEDKVDIKLPAALIQILDAPWNLSRPFEIVSILTYRN